MKLSISIKMSQSYFDLYGRYINKYYIKDDNIYIDIVKSEKEKNAIKTTINYLLDNNIGLLNHSEFIESVQKKRLRGEWDNNIYDVSKDDEDDSEYRELLERMYDITNDLPYICNRYSKSGFGQPNGWSLMIESS
jgi:hypothetical protein